MYELRGVPKKFKTRAQVMAFLSNSPGYVSRQRAYLQRYWPGLYAEVSQTSKSAKGYAGSHAIFVPPALQKGKAQPPASVVVKPRKEPLPTAEDKAATAAARRKASLGLKTTRDLGPNVADLVPTPRPRTGSSLLDFLHRDPIIRHAPGVAKAIGAAAEDLGNMASSFAGTQGRNLSPRSGSQFGQPVSRKPDYAPSDFGRDVEKVSDQVLGKGLTNLAQGQGPKNWQDVAGLGIGVASILPVGRGAKASGKALKAAIDAAEAAHNARPIVRVTKAARLAARAPENQILRSLPAEKAAANLRQFTNPKNVGKGAAQNIPTMSNGDLAAGHQVVGKIEPEAWAARTAHAVGNDPQLALSLAHWYEELGPLFHTFFGEDAAPILRGFAVSQANASPTGGLLNVLRVRDKLLRGEPIEKNEISTVVKSIEAAYKGEHVSDGMAAKLHDFADSLEGKTTRTWTNDDIAGGSPTAIDIHAQRDLGRIDPKILATLRERHGLPVAHLQLETMQRELKRLQGKKLSGEFTAAAKRAAIKEQKGKIAAFKASDGDAIAKGKASGLTLDNPQASASGNAYNDALREYQAITDHLNETEFFGKKDWTPAQTQALGWSAIQRFHGVTPEDAMYAINRNTHVVTFAGAKKLEPQIRQIVKEEGGIWRDAIYGPGARAGETTPTVSLHVFGSPEQGDRIAQRIATKYGDMDVTAQRPGVVNSRAWGRSKFAIEVESPAFTSKRAVNQFWNALQQSLTSDLHAANLTSFTPYTWHNPETGKKVFGLRIITGHGYVPMSNADATGGILSKYADALDAASVKSGHDIEFGPNNVEIRSFHGGDTASSTAPGAPGEPAADRAAAEAQAPQGIGARLSSERGELALDLSRPETGDLDAILAKVQGEERRLGYEGASVPMQSARSRLTRNVVEKPADKFSTWLDSQTPSARAISRVLWTAPASMRVSKQMGRRFRAWGNNLSGQFEAAARALPKAGSASDTAHFWWAQMGESLRGGTRGLEAVRGLQKTELDKITSGQAFNELAAQLDDVKSQIGILRNDSLGAAGDVSAGQWVNASDQGNWGRVLSVDGDQAKVYFVSRDGAEATVALPTESLRAPTETARTESGESIHDLLAHMEDVRIEMKGLEQARDDLTASLAVLDGLIKDPPKYDPRIVKAMEAFSADRRKILEEAGYLKDAEGANAREGLLSDALGLSSSEKKVYVGHRQQKPRASSDPYPIRLGLGRPGLPPGVTTQNRLKNVLRGRVRTSTHVVVDDWLATQTFRQAKRTRQELGALGVKFDQETFDPKKMYIVNPKGRAIPPEWKNGNRIDQMVDGGADEEELRKAAKEITDNYLMPEDLTAEGQAAWIAKAREQGVQWHELRMVRKDVANRYFSQFAKSPKAGKAAGAYDSAVDTMVASLIFARIGYIPKNITQNLIMALPHQGVFAFANVPRATQVMLDPKLDELQRRFVSEVSGASLELGSEAIGRQAQIRKGTHAIAAFSGNIADSMPRVSAMIHELAALNVIPKASTTLSSKDVATLMEVFDNPAYRDIVDAARERSVEAMADFSRLTPKQTKMARRWLIIPSWLWAGSRYPVHFAVNHPVRSAAIAYAGLGAPYLDKITGDRVDIPSLSDLEVSDVPAYAKGIGIGDKVLRTNSLSPISTPTEIFHSTIGQGENLVGGLAQPLATAAFNTAMGQIPSPRGGSYQKGEGFDRYVNAAKANFGRLVPDVRLAKDMIHPHATDTYPDDDSRLQRILRETGVVPIKVGKIPETGGKARAATELEALKKIFPGTGPVTEAAYAKRGQVLEARSRAKKDGKKGIDYYRASYLEEWKVLKGDANYDKAEAWAKTANIVKLKLARKENEDSAYGDTIREAHALAKGKGYVYDETLGEFVKVDG